MNRYREDKEKIGSRIQEIRLKRNMTQEYLAYKANICNAQQISNIERGLAGISLARFKDICEVLEIEADYLLFGITSGKIETLLHIYIKRLTSEQSDSLFKIIKVYMKSCGINEKELE